MHKNDIDLHTSLRDFVNFAATLQPSNAGTFHADEQTLLETMCATLSKHPSAFDGNSTSHPSLAIVETYLPQLLGTMSDPTTRSTVESLTRHLNWYQIYDKATIDQSLAEGMFAAHVLGTRGLIKSTSLFLGLFLLGPGVHYPLHYHAAQEFYHVLSGEIAIQQGLRNEFKTLSEGMTSMTLPNRIHALETRDHPCLIMFLWTGDISGKNWWLSHLEEDLWQKDCWERQNSGVWINTERVTLRESDLTTLET